MVDLALIVLRVAAGALLAGHGAQKLFGWFGGHRLTGTAQFMETLHLRPGRAWAMLAGLTELAGGLLILLGLLSPIGPLAVIGAMVMAALKVHWGKPIWVTSGGAELPLTYAGIAATLALSGPGYYSLDRALNVQMPSWVSIAAVAAILIILALGWLSGMELRTTTGANRQAA